MIAIETKNLSKEYVSSFGRKKVYALSGLDLAINEGTIFGLLGPNGAGKTTLVKLLLEIIFPTSGSAKILNEDIADYSVKKRIGYLPENHKYPSYLTGGDVLKFFGRLSGMEGLSLQKKTDELLELVKLTKWKKSKIKTYSKGMMQRLGLAQSLINDPELIFLDEPTDGVDPIGRKEIRDILLELKNRSKTIFLNSHLLSEVEQITDRVGILNKGMLLREGTVKELTEKKEEYTLVVANPEINITQYSNSSTLITRSTNGTFSIKVDNIEGMNQLVDKLRTENILIKEMVLQKTSLEEMFISLINEEEKGSSK